MMAERLAGSWVMQLRDCAKVVFVSSEGEMSRYLPFPFEGDRFPDALGAVVQRTVLEGEQPAREVVHFSAGSWAVGDGVNDPNISGSSVATHIAHAIERNSSIARLATMPPGHVAERSGPDDAWTISLLDESD
jgi:hypothetical protein